MPERRPNLRRAVNVDDIRELVDKQGLQQVELCRALRALSEELRCRFGIYSAAASDEVFDRIEKGTAPQSEEDSSRPTTPGWPRRRARSPRAPSPTPREVSASDGSEVLLVSDPLKSANFPMHAEVAAFQRQSERTERLQREVGILRKAVDQSAANFKRIAEDEVDFAIKNIEAKASLTQMDHHEELKALLDQALDQREHLASLARDAVEDRFRIELQTLSEATSKSLHALQEDVAKNEEHSVQEVQYLGCRIDAVLEEIAKVQQSSRETAEASAHMVSSTLADFRTQELHAQANEYRELREATSSVAQGVLRLAQVCGVLPGPTCPEQKDVDPLYAELCGRGIRHRIDDAWAVISKGCANTTALMLQKADELFAIKFAAQIGDFDARVYHECLHLVAAHQGFKEGLELSLPSKHYVRYQKASHRTPSDQVSEKDVLARGPSPFRDANSALSTTVPTEPVQTPRTPLVESRPYTPPYTLRGTGTAGRHQPLPRNLERPGSAQLRSIRMSFDETQRPASTN